jgi:chromosomal replication initiator protein
MRADQIWQAALGELQLQMTKATFETWVKNTHVISHEDGTFIIGVHNAFTKDWLENRLLTTIKRTLVGIVGHSVEVKFAIWTKEPPENDEALPLLQATAPLSNESATNGLPTMPSPRYTFDNFVVGSSNRLAHAASLAVAEKPAEAYNPLFLYGGVGLGKTHLLHAVGYMSQQRCSEVLYVSSETFTNDLINSIRNHTTEGFRERYRNIDVLLVDDIQFIAGKESTQEEFFHTFNTLHSASKQIVISSDRAPKAILTLEERLRSRFEWGLIADIQPPDLETRMAILRFKAEQQSKDIVAARQMAMYLAREETNASLPQIGRALGGRDHTTVLHGYQKIRAQVEEDDRLRREMLAIKELLYNHQGSSSRKQILVRDR